MSTPTKDRASLKMPLSAMGSSARMPGNMLLAAKQTRSYVVNGKRPARLKLVVPPPPWEKLSQYLKLMAAFGYMKSRPGYTPCKVTFNVHHKLSRRLFLGECDKYLWDRFRESVKGVIPNEELYYLLIQEAKNAKRVHYHGVILLPTPGVEDAALKLERLLSETGLCRKYKAYFDNKVVEVASTWKKSSGSEFIDAPINFYWIEYISKELTEKRPVFMTKALRRESRRFVSLIRELAKLPAD